MALFVMFTLSAISCSKEEPVAPAPPEENVENACHIGKDVSKLDSQLTNDISQNPEISCSYVIVDAENPYFSSLDGVLFNKDKTKLILYPRGKENTEYEVPSSVVYIDDYAFANNDNLRKVSFAQGSGSLAPVSFGRYVFKNTKLENISFPEDFSEFGRGCFENCDVDMDFTIPKSMVTECFKYGLLDGPRVRFVGCNEENPVFSVKDNYVYDKSGEKLISCATDPLGNDAKQGDLKLPEGIKSIGSLAFYLNRNNIDRIILPASLTKIEKDAFYGNSGQSVSIPANITVEPYAFRWNRSLETITFGEGFKTIPENICYESEIKKIVFPATLNTIGKYAFCGCKSLESVVFPDGLSVVGTKAFYGCSRLVELRLPASLERIEEQAFYYVREGQDATGSTEGVTVYCYAVTPPKVIGNGFYTFRARLYVPSLSVASYERAYGWSDFSTVYSGLGIKPIP